MKKGLARFVIAVLTIIASVAVIDLAVGRLMDYMLPKISNQGDTGKTYFSLYDVNSPVVIVGSSRAAHHYVTQMIEDSLKISAYNVGRDGCFFSYNCCVVNSILDRYKPELIVWENGTEYLYEGISDPLELLYPYYSQNIWVNRAVKEELSWTERVMLNSRCYQYNSSIHKILLRFLGRRSFVDETVKGYLPIKPKDINGTLVLEPEDYNVSNLSDSKVERFRAILERASQKGVKIIIVDSPKYRKRDYENLSKEKMCEICGLYDALFLDNSQSSYFWDHPELFNDATHLNDNGAKMYTEMFLGQILDFFTNSKQARYPKNNMEMKN